MANIPTISPMDGSLNNCVAIINTTTEDTIATSNTFCKELVKIKLRTVKLFCFFNRAVNRRKAVGKSIIHFHIRKPDKCLLQ